MVLHRWEYGYCWTSSEGDGSKSWLRTLGIGADVYRQDSVNQNGFPTRCVQDYMDACGELNGDNTICLDECAGS